MRRLPQPALESLPRRETGVLVQVLEGAANKFIARALGISHRTVEIHRARAMLKLGATSTPRTHPAGVGAAGTLRSSGGPQGASGGRAAWIGALEICMRPENGSTISMMRNRAADTERATSTSATADVGFTGENRQ